MKSIIARQEQQERDLLQSQYKGLCRDITIKKFELIDKGMSDIQSTKKAEKIIIGQLDKHSKLYLYLQSRKNRFNWLDRMEVNQ